MATLNFNINGVASKIPVLNSSDQVPKEHLPRRTWKKMALGPGVGQREVQTFYKNPHDWEIVVHVCTSTETDNNGNAEWTLRDPAVPGVSHPFIHTFYHGAGVRGRTSMFMTVPAGWEYRLAASALGTRTISEWRELS